MKKNLVVSGIGADALENVCLQVIQWGNCYKYLSTFVAPNQSQELQVNGLIFKVKLFLHLMLHFGNHF